MKIIDQVFRLVCDTSWRAACVIPILLCLDRLLRGRIPARILFLTWIAIASRLLVPLGFSAGWSPFNLAHFFTGGLPALAAGSSYPRRASRLRYDSRTPPSAQLPAFVSAQR